MRPHRLELTAFGAFPGVVELDLDQLGAGGLVLLCGETGGGKTTLLDALGFALYGAVPGLRGVRDLRSHHAAADAAPRVRLEYSVPAGRFRVTRSPGWDRPKRRGTGTQREHPKATLEKWTGSGWRTEATRNDDVGLEISLHLGMKPEQFFQVVMLPQGRFADFLHADNDAREALLKQLFSVGLFERVEQWLADRAKRATDDYNVARQSLDRVHAKIIEAAGLEGHPDDDRPKDSLPADEWRDDATPGGTDERSGPGWVASLAEAARAGQISAAARRDAAARARELADHQLATTREAARRAEDRTLLRTRLLQLDELAPEISSLAAELDAAGRAGAVSRAVADAAGRADEAGRATRDEAAARAALDAAAVPSLDVTPEPAGQLRASPDADADGLGWLAAHAHTESGRLEVLALALTTADEAEREVAAADRDALIHAQAAEVRVTEIETTFPAVRQTAQARVERARQAARIAPALAERADQLADLADAVRARQAALLAAGDTQAVAVRARARAAELRQQRFDAITAELAAALADDAPCPVCGSLAHPDPAEVRADHVNKDDERAADEDASRREAAARDAQGRVAGLTGQVRTLRATLLRAPEALRADEPAAAGADAGAGAVQELLGELRGTLLDEAVLLAGPADGADTAAYPAGLSAGDGPGPAEGSAAELAAVARAFAASAADAATTAGDLAGAEAELAELARAETAAHADLATHRSEERQAGLRAAAARDRAARALAKVPDPLRDRARLAQRVDAVAAFAGRCEAAREAVLTAARAAGEARRAEAAATAAATEAGFAGPADALAAVRDTTWLADAQARIQAHREERVKVQSRLEAPELAGITDDAPIPLEQHERAAQEARTAHEDALAAVATATERSRRLAALVEEYAGAYAELAPRRTTADQLRALAELATGRGGNLHGMPLSSYVLAARLEEVAQAASRRLSVMSGGRYTLVHDAGERRDRRRRAGLGLLVEDAWTGRSRPTATLSGGETFQAALSLALGLADVVSAESGGHAIDALFIDEGFGTLDPDSLDEVMNVLDELRSGGRLVGVVSHVADLRLRIPTQIQVHKGPNGSTVDTTT
ncbi:MULTISPECIES: AAA family ATPase [Pseudofrankia]|uniref:AAA family ATPase n=1 Tax=Pseudofrankia TaxID=2994363 RepID=UPI00048A06FD|nr:MULTISPECIES: SMC family ATPase [Pseudofrankia]OHV34745.1 hypothetical protein BCD49_22580 [Pseudofrankia sp. EUN1h]